MSPSRWKAFRQRRHRSSNHRPQTWSSRGNAKLRKRPRSRRLRPQPTSSRKGRSTVWLDGSRLLFSGDSSSRGNSFLIDCPNGGTTKPKMWRCEQGHFTESRYQSRDTFASHGLCIRCILTQRRAVRVTTIVYIQGDQETQTAANVMANVGDSCVPVRRPGSGTDPLPYRERTTSSVSAAIVIAARSLAARARLHAHTRVPSLWQAELLD